MTTSNSQHSKLRPARDILLELFDCNENELAVFLLRHTFFLHPDRIRRRYEQTGSASWFPVCVRMSNQYHPKKRRKESSTWEGRNVQVCDNTKARQAFASFSGLVMAGDRDGRIRGYHVAHIWERVYDPACFTAGWNMCLMPGFLKLFTEQQDRIALLHHVIQQAAYDLYFRESTIGLPTPVFVTDHRIDLRARFPDLMMNVL